MFSTLRILRSRNLASLELVSKNWTSGIHLCVNPVATKHRKHAFSFNRHAPLTLLPLNSMNFMSTAPNGKGATVPVEDQIPEPPTPVAESANLQVFQKEEDLILFLEALTKVEKSGSKEILADQVSLLPEPPAVPEALQSDSDILQLHPNGEPTFESIGLGGWSPTGMVQNCMEFLHINLDIPWWGAIVIGTICVRTIIFPLVILSQRNAAKMNNHLPQLQALQLKMTEARQRGDRLDSARYAQEMLTFMKEKNLSPFKNMLVPMAQAPIFITFFMSLREMANLPVDSLRTGGLFWFTDLTLTDQFYLLPIITSVTLYITIEVGTDAARLNSANLGLMKYVLRALPIAIFPFTMGFPAAILVYWTSTNFISLIQVSFLKIPRVRKFFNIDQLINHDTKKLPIKDKGFVKGVKESWENLKITRELDDRQRIDEMNFMKAGRGAVTKTYKYDPTQRPPRSIGAIEAKKRE